MGIFVLERVRAEDLPVTIDLFTHQIYPGDPKEARQHCIDHAEGQADIFLAWVDGRLAGYLTIRCPRISTLNSMLDGRSGCLCSGPYP